MMQPNNVFLISTPRNMFEKMKSEYKDFKKNPSSSRHAINFVLTAHHLREWVWKAYLKNDEVMRYKIKNDINSAKDFYKFVNNECNEMKYMKELANNSKHFYRQNSGKIKKTGHTKTWGETECKWKDMNYNWEYDGLIVTIKGKGCLSALALFETVHNWWSGLFKTYFADKE